MGFMAVGLELQSLIRARREGQVHPEADLVRLAQAAADPETPDHLLAAWLMAAFLRPLSFEETAHLTRAMAESGDRVDLTGLPRPWVDKHSTGGVGDKTTLVLLPLLAACGLTVVKMSGPGLGKTGGTVDKLGSIPGFRLDLSPEEMKTQAQSVGLALTGQTPRLAPADKRLYRLRDETATIESVPLIVASILSKKMAGGADTVVLDVKCGAGAFMETDAQARELADWLTRVGRLARLRVQAVVTDMEQPLGRTAGNALEVKEAWRVLRGEEPGRFADLCRHLAATALVTAEVVKDVDAAAGQVDEALKSGRAYQKAQDWVAAQGGDPRVFEGETWHKAPLVRDIKWSGGLGWVERVDANAVGWTVVDLGGGRMVPGAKVDPRVGVETLVEVGDQVTPGSALFRVHAADEAGFALAERRLKSAVGVRPERVPARAVVR